MVLVEYKELLLDVKENYIYLNFDYIVRCFV